MRTFLTKLAFNLDQLEVEWQTSEGSNHPGKFWNPNQQIRDEVQRKLALANAMNQELPKSLRFPGDIDLVNMTMVATSHVPLTYDFLTKGDWLNRGMKSQQEGFGLMDELLHAATFHNTEQRQNAQRDVLERMKVNDFQTMQLRSIIRTVLLLETNTFRGTELVDSLQRTSAASDHVNA